MTTESSATPLWPDDARRLAFERWLASLGEHRVDPASVRPASADASFRRYFRVDTDHGTRIVMDAPPAHEDCRPFVQLAGMLREAGLDAPEVQAWDEANGFMLLGDLGDTTYLSQLDARTAPALYGAASEALVKLQGIAAEDRVPAYDRELLMRELQLFPDWYVGRHAGIALDDTRRQQLAQTFELIVANNLAQPRVLVHRDYHSRNLMVTGDEGPGILDFQDAVWGPVTYDLVSLLRDAYIDWEEEQQIDWAIRHWERARRAGLPVDADFGQFWRDFEWMGLQRQLKVLGIFCRLNYRDGKDGYLKDLPRVWRYAHRVAMRYNGLGALAQLLEQAAGEARDYGYSF